MQAEKALIVLVVSALVVVGFGIGFMFLTFEPASGGNHTTAQEGVAQDVDLLSEDIQLPDWSIVFSDGSVSSLSSFRGRFLVVDLMATWCGSCEAQNLELLTLYDNMGDNIYLISLTVDVSENEALMAEYKADRELPWPHGLDTQSVFSNYFNVQYIPSMVILDADGYLRWFHEGSWSESNMAQTLASLA